jgi:hypothetical protein
MDLEQRQAYGERALIFWWGFIFDSIEQTRLYIQSINWPILNCFSSFMTDPISSDRISGTGNISSLKALWSLLVSPGPSCLVEIRGNTAYKAVELPSRVRSERQAASGHREPCTGRHIATGRLYSSCLSHCVARRSHNCVATEDSKQFDIR